jgi:DNA-binding MarR family transcriptional regulator
MMDAGQDAGFSLGFGSGDFARAGPAPVVRTAPVPPPDDGRINNLRRPDGYAPDLYDPDGHDPDGHDPDGSAAGAISPDDFATHVIGPGRAGLDPLALRALAGQMRSGQFGVDPGGSEQAMTIARQVADMAQGLAALADRLVGQGAAAAAETIDVAEGDCVAFLESQFRIRRLRARHLPALSLGEPAWDILLDLAVAQYWRRETSVTSLCIAADVPSTTALRWINSMTREGLIVRRPCQRDGRRSFLAIAPETYQAMLAMAADSLRTEKRVRNRYQRAA